MLITRFIIISLICFSSSPLIQKDSTTFISPVKIPLELSSNFGELRIDHYHSGIDIKTQGVTGKEVVATADGYIYRISITPGGYGNALYLKHPSGYETVYGHLDHFTNEVDDYVKNNQYAKKSFQITLFPPRDKFIVKQGDIIAYSGNSGGSAGPHLHYEVRESASERPLNPLRFDFGVADNVAPVIEKLAIYPGNNKTLINGKNSVIKLNVIRNNETYFLQDDQKISIKGLAGFGIKSFDRFSDSNNKCSAYSLKLAIDSTIIFNYVMDDFSFAESRYINSHIDYESYIRESAYFERTFILPNDKLGAYKDIIDRGLYNFNDGRTHLAEITLTDANNNITVLRFKILPDTINSDLKQKTENHVSQEMPYNKTNRFISSDIAVTIPNGALYDTLLFSYSRTPGQKDMLSDIHTVHNIYEPVHKAYTLMIKPEKILSGKESKMTIVQLGDNNKKFAVSSTWSGEYLKSEVSVFGDFFIGIDTIPPVVSANGPLLNSDLRGKKELRIKITDDFSGIKNYEPIIDGEWALFEYDSKNSVIIYKFDDKRIIKERTHNLILNVSDNMDNLTQFQSSFTW